MEDAQKQNEKLYLARCDAVYGPGERKRRTKI